MIPAIRSPLFAFGSIALFFCACDDTPTRQCKVDSDCKLPERCTPQGVCAVPEGFADGKPCLSSEQCQSRLCLDQGQGGLCTSSCPSPAGCAAGQVCVPAVGHALSATATSTAAELKLICQASGSGQLFLGEACTDDKACRSGFCEGNACTQPCGTCPGLMSCDQTTVGRAGASLTTGSCKTKFVDRLELGPVNVSATAASLLTFDIAQGVESFLVFADDKEDLRVALTRLEAPGGAVLVDLAKPAAALMRAYDYYGTGSAQVPGTDNPKAKVQPGNYKLAVRTYEQRLDVYNPVAGTIENVGVISRRSSQKGGLLDLDLFFAPGTGITAAAPTSFVTEMLNELQVLSRSLLGIGLGEVRYFDLTVAEDTITDADESRSVRKKYSRPGPHGLSVSVFVVKAMTYGYEAVAGGIPGVPGLANRPTSGIVAEMQSTSKNMGHLLAHEIGHYLGLFHTTESGAGTVDPISDTPSCPAGTEISSCPDRQNLMFPFYLTSPEPLGLTAGQALVMRGSPFLYEIVYPEACGPGTEVVDVTTYRFAAGTTVGSPSRLAGPCGGSNASERVHLYRVGNPAPKSLEVEVVGRSFDPVVYALRGDCTSSAPVVGCQSGVAGTAVKLTVTAPQPGPYFFVVDGKTGSGTYTLAVH